MKKIQIDESLFWELYKYFCMDFHEHEKTIKDELQKKSDALMDRHYYTKYKTAPSDDEKQEARQTYLDRRGVLPDFRF